MSSKVKRVLFVQKFVPHYRLPLFERLRSQLEQEGIEFKLIFGEPDPFEGSKVKMAYPAWGDKVDSKIIKVFGRFLYWQGVVFKLKKGDVVIVEQAAKLLDNYPLFFLQQIGFVRLCYFGHGRNFQDKYELTISRRIKQLMVRRISKWFAYTKMSVDALLQQGVSAEKIVSVNNTLELNSNVKVENVTRKLNQFIYVGGLYKDKRIRLLLDSVALVKSEVAEFEFHVVGNGPDAQLVREFSKANPWCVYHESLYGDERDRLLYESSAILMPGLVGLIAVDSFHFACPILTTDCGQHSPEFVYLENRVNALILDNEGRADSYAEQILTFIRDTQLSEKVRQGCRLSASQYTIDDTASRFVSGILDLQSA